MGDAFRDAVVFSLRRAVISVQTVPASAAEDCGIDALSHNETRAYCCLGLELVSSDTKKKINDKICSFFQDKLRKIFELARPKTRRAKHRHCPNNALSSIMAEGRKVRFLSLIVNSYDDSSILATLHTYFSQCMEDSSRRYVSDECELTILGPRDLALEAGVDEQTLFHLENPAFHALFEETSEDEEAFLAENAVEDFQAKFDYLAPLGSSSVQAKRVNSLRSAYHRAWMKSIVRDTHIANSFPEVHRKIERIRATVVTDAHRESMRNIENAAELISRVESAVRERIEREFGEQLPEYILRDLGEGELARLIGTCPLDWRQ